MGNADPKTTITTYVSDMLALVRHGITAISRQFDNLKNEGHPEARALIAEFRSTLEGHAKLLETRLQGLGGHATSPVKEAASAVAGVAAGLINAVRPEEASKSVRDDYTYLSHVAIAYLMLHTTSSSLSDQLTAELAERGYRDAARLIVKIDALMPTLVLQELRQDGLAVRDVADECRTLIKNAWQRETRAAGVTP